MRDSTLLLHTALISFVLVVTCVVTLGLTSADAQQASSQTQPSDQRWEELAPVEIDAPRSDRRQVQTATGTSGEGFGTSEPIPAGQPGSDYPLTPGEVVSTGGRPQNLANVPAAVSIVENKGIAAQGNLGVPTMLQGLPGVYTSGYSAVPFDSEVVMRGFSNAPQDRVNLLYDGRSLNSAMRDAPWMAVFPEAIERIEVLRGDGTVQFGTKAIGGAVNIIPKRPRQNPGTYWGAEVGSWQTNRGWVASNMVKGPLAAGMFVGAYFTDGFRVYEGNGRDEEPLPRPGPWSMTSLQGSVNWKITPGLAVEFSQLLTNTRAAYAGMIDRTAWERRDTRNVPYFFAFDGPYERWDSVSIARLFYEGGRLGNFEIIANYYRDDLRIDMWYGWAGMSDRRWQDEGLSFKYFRKDKFSVLTNELTVGLDLLDGKFVREARSKDNSTHEAEASGYRESISYYVMNQIRLWDRLYLDLGYRCQSFDLKDLYANDNNRSITSPSLRLGRNKSASQWAVGLVYDKELGSSVYYKHSRTYRFPEFWDMVKAYMPYYPPIPPFVLLDPEEGTLQEWGLRHWFTPNIYASVVYYDLYMDNEILNGIDLLGQSINMNVRDVSHSGVEIDALLRITPCWTLQGTWTRQMVRVRSNFLPGLTPINGLTTEDKWIFQNPGEMANVSLKYNNDEWGFSAMIKYYYVGSRYRQNDVYNIWEPLEPAKWGDLAFSQSFFDNDATVYFGIRNFTDRQYALIGYLSPPSIYSPLGSYEGWFPNEGRTYYGGVKANLNFDRMRVPTIADLERMQRRLYGTFESAVGSVYRWGARIPNLANVMSTSRNRRE
ncbi:MAG: TonB-dependent receptor [Thermodesulfobacteriota bacterium]